jgi:histidine triad (HIT) family protein
MSPSECIFCRIAAGEVPATVVHENYHTIAFRDLHPKAPVHVLIIPKKHIGSVDEVTEDDRGVMGALFTAARDIARAEGVAEKGYRVVMNTGKAAGQTVGHAHLHLLAGRDFTWPPG